MSEEHKIKGELTITVDDALNPILLGKEIQT